MGKSKIGFSLTETFLLRLKRKYYFKPFMEKFVSELYEVGVTALEIPEKHKFKEAEIEFLNRIRKDYRLTYTFHSNTPGGYLSLLSHPEDFSKKLKKCFANAKKFRARLIVMDLDSYMAEPDTDLEKLRESLWKLAITNLNYAYDEAEKENIEIGFENGDVRDMKVSYHIKFNMTLDEMKRFVKKVEKLKLTLDIGHLYCSSNYFGFNYKDYIKEFNKKVIHVHVSDNFGLEDGIGSKTLEWGDLHLPLGYGNLPWQEMVSLLQQLGYKGIYVLEIKPYRITENEEKIREIIKDSARKLYEFIKSKRKI